MSTLLITKSYSKKVSSIPRLFDKKSIKQSYFSPNFDYVKKYYANVKNSINRLPFNQISPVLSRN